MGARVTFELEPSPKPRERRTRSQACARCDGRGWVKGWIGKTVDGTIARRDDWPVPCRRCNGAGKIKPMKLARALGLNRRDVYKVDTLTAGSRVGLRVLNAIARVFPEAFA
jgi:DnaJ-class molecular chaperone